MKIACNECRQRLSDVLDETANTEADSALAEHLAACDSCRSELQMLQATREELRAFPILTAPSDLRARVRTSLEAEPIVAPSSAAREENPRAKNETITAPAIITTSISQTTRRAVPQETGSADEPKWQQTWRDNFRSFLSNPTNITWASCCVLLLFCFISFSRRPEPSGQYDNITRPPLGDPYEKRYNGDEEVPPQYVAPDKNGPAFNYEPYSKNPPRTAPGETPQWPQPNSPGTASPALAAKSPGQQPNPKADSSNLANGSSTQQNNPKPQAPYRSNLPLPAPGSTRKTDSNGEASQKPAPRTSERTRKENRAPSMATAPSAAKDSQNSYLARAPAGASGPAGPSSSADRAMESDDSPRARTTREITTRLTPPRTVGWSQISVVLSGGARFADGTKSRVIWRGAAQANEPIELSFSVQSAESGDAKITLQEVKNGQAQTIAYKSLPIAARR